jgi:hypothetical protein
MRLAKQSQFNLLQNGVYFIMLPFLVRKIFTFYIKDVLLLNVQFQGKMVKFRALFSAVVYLQFAQLVAAKQLRDKITCQIRRHVTLFILDMKIDSTYLRHSDVISKKLSDPDKTRLSSTISTHYVFACVIIPKRN